MKDAKLNGFFMKVIICLLLIGVTIIVIATLNITNLANQAFELQREVEQLNYTIEEYKDKVNDNLQMLDIADEREDTLTNEYISEKDKQEKLSNDVDNLKQTIVKKEEDVNKQKTIVQDKQKEINDLKQLIDELKEDKEDLKDEIDGLCACPVEEEPPECEVNCT